ncbi:MAG: amidohydrolase family protein [Candidatus Aenigmarchaeota archaeon]|nr:amidohydrolase family protein [Candidatus Aenigmarchaeota archaeon]
MSLLIKNGRIFIGGKLLVKNILTEDSIISSITSGIPQADEIINAGGKIVIPGVIDPHVHFREPGMIQKEDFLSGSTAAASGGVTCFLDMPNNRPPTLTKKDLEMKRVFARKSVVNFGFHFGSSTGNIGEIRNARCIASVKIFMNASTGNMLIENEETIRKIMESSKMNTIHAEGKDAERAIKIARSAGKRFYLCHVSDAKEIEKVRENEKRNVFAEVTPHHLFLTKKDQNRMVKMKPPLKGENDRKALWEALRDGTIDTIGSDHAPHRPEEKMSSELFGVPGVETRLPLMLDAVNRGLLNLGRAVQTMCENPAMIFKIKNKGFIKEGKDADLTIIDMKLKKRVRNDSLLTKCGWSPFDGFELKGWPTHTIVNGRVVYENGSVAEKDKGTEVSYD